MRIVHFSDIHVGRLPRDPGALLDKRLLGTLNFLLCRRRGIDEQVVRLATARIRALKPDVVVCTGDLTCTGAPEEFAGARSLLKPLTEAGAGDLLVVPGNHDLYVRNEKCRRECADTIRWLNADSLSLPQLPCEVRRGGLRLFLLNESRPQGPLSSGGALSVLSEQWLRERVSETRGEAERRIAVGHFPVRNAAGRRLGGRRRLRNGEAIDQALRSGELDVALCGHIHTPFRRDERSGAMEICAGSLSVAGKINIVDYCPLSGELVQHWDDVGGAAPPETELARPFVPAEAGAVR